LDTAKERVNILEDMDRNQPIQRQRRGEKNKRRTEYFR